MDKFIVSLYSEYYKCSLGTVPVYTPVFLKSASFVSFTDKNFKCLTEIKILSVRMSIQKFKMFYKEQELVWQKITRSGMMYLSVRPNVWQV